MTPGEQEYTSQEDDNKEHQTTLEQTDIQYTEPNQPKTPIRTAIEIIRHSLNLLPSGIIVTMQLKYWLTGLLYKLEQWEYEKDSTKDSNEDNP